MAVVDEEAGNFFNRVRSVSCCADGIFRHALFLLRHSLDAIKPQEPRIQVHVMATLSLTIVPAPLVYVVEPSQHGRITLRCHHKQRFHSFVITVILVYSKVDLRHSGHFVLSSQWRSRGIGFGQPRITHNPPIRFVPRKT